MNKSTPIIKNPIGLSEMRTWQSGILQSSLHRYIRKITDQYLQKYDLTSTHWLIIGAILDTKDQGIRITDLAEIIGTTLGYLTNSINNLELKGMVLRVDHGTDSRTKILTIPHDFKVQCDEIEEGLRDIYRNELYKKITRDELKTYVTVLQKLSSVD